MLLAVNMYFSGMTSLTVTARQLYVMARDGCFPGSNQFRSVNETGVPVGGVLLTLTLDILLVFLNLVSVSAFVAVTSVATIGFQISYAIPIFLRITGHGKRTFKQSSAFSCGRWSFVIGWISLIWLVFTSILFLLPTSYPITLETISWSSIIVGGTLIAGGTFWGVTARYWFVGPKRYD